MGLLKLRTRIETHHLSLLVRHDVRDARKYGFSLVSKNGYLKSLDFSQLVSSRKQEEIWLDIQIGTLKRFLRKFA
jgi:hypothetical protein